MYVDHSRQPGSMVVLKETQEIYYHKLNIQFLKVTDRVSVVPETVNSDYNKYLQKKTHLSFFFTNHKKFLNQIKIT